MSRFGTAQRWIGPDAIHAAHQHTAWLKRNMTRGPGTMSPREVAMADVSQYEMMEAVTRNVATGHMEKHTVRGRARG